MAQLNARGPVGWSASGKFLATGGGKVFDSSGAAKGALFSGAASQWAWSPAGDCALGIVAGKLELGVPGRRGGTLLSATVTGFSISPNGRKVGIAAQDDVSNTFWIADLAGGGLTKVHEVGATVAGTVFGWAPDSKTLYIGSSGTSAGADGYRITSVKVVGGGVLRHRLGLSALAGPDTFSACRSRLLVVAGGTRDTTTNKRLAYLTARKAHYITPQGTTYPSAACSPKLDFIAAVGAPDGSDVSARRLELLRGDGSVAQALTAGSYWDDDPMWGPAGTGIVLVRTPTGGGSPQVWYIREGSSAQPTGLALKAAGDYFGQFGWDALLGWSAVAPTGLPVSN